MITLKCERIKKMKNKMHFCLFLIGLIPLFNGLVISQDHPERWKTWLDEVESIMTRSERSVFKTLKTEEDRKRFQDLFWQIRDPSPGTPGNEFKEEFQNRLQYARTRLGGIHSDRGRVYVILGKPAETKNFAGSEKVVDCELWIYRAEGRSGLPPVMYLLFYRRDNIGDYTHYYPGAQSSLDILSTRYRRSGLSKARAFKIIQKSFPELAKATLSVIPDEANIAFASTLNSSAQIIGQIYTLPEREVEKSYLKNFTSPGGTIEVDYFTKQIAGKAMLFLTEYEGVKFLNYSLMPDRVKTSATHNGIETVQLTLHLRIEDKTGNTIYQKENEIHLRFDEAQKKSILERKITFNDSAPIIEGEFHISLTFSNKTSEEFFVHTQGISVNDQTVPIVVGYEIKTKKPGVLTPFSLDSYKVLLDPRSIFTGKDSLEGLVLSKDISEFFLKHSDGEGPLIKLQDVSRMENLVTFRQRLAEFKPGIYDFIVKRNEEEIFRWPFSIISFDVEKPVELERIDTHAIQQRLPFIIGQEYLNSGQVNKALESFQKFPEDLWDKESLPVMARAYYIQKDYARVLELLQRDAVEKNYSVLLLLGNSSLKLKKLERAALYFEEIRKYGDTVEANKTLGAIYYSLGERDKAKVYWDRAKKLERRSDEKDQNK